jgi:hypothetical protein
VGVAGAGRLRRLPLLSGTAPSRVVLARVEALQGRNRPIINSEIPLPYVAAPFAAFAVWLWFRDRRQDLGGCPRCGYDVSAMPSGVCPECGARVGERLTM